MVHESVGSFAETRLHPVVLRSLHAAGLHRPTVVQRNLLSCAGDTPDVVVQTGPNMGRSTAIAAYAAHCALTSHSAALIVTDSYASGQKLKATFDHLRFEGVGFENRFTEEGRAVIDSMRAPCVVGCSIADAMADTVSDRFLEQVSVLIVQDAVTHEASRLASVISRVTSIASNAAGVVLLSSAPPSSIEISVRYLLRRSHRRYFFLEPGGITYTTLLCQNDEDRADLCLRAAEISGLRRVLVTTHNREVRELKAFLQRELQLRTYSVQRSTTAADREKALSDFLESRFAVLVAVDAYTGIDLMDVDAVIQYYPPQKSMPDDEWSFYAACLNTTCNPASPTLVVSIAAPDELSMMSYFFKKVGVDVPVVLNLSPTHVQFAELVRRPDVALDAKVYGIVAPASSSTGSSGGAAANGAGSTAAVERAGAVGGSTETAEEGSAAAAAATGGSGGGQQRGSGNRGGYSGRGVQGRGGAGGGTARGR